MTLNQSYSCTTSQRMVDPFLDDRGTFVYDKILARLIETNERLKTLGSESEADSKGEGGELK